MSTQQHFESNASPQQWEPVDMPHELVTAKEKATFRDSMRSYHMRLMVLNKTLGRRSGGLSDGLPSHILDQILRENVRMLVDQTEVVEKAMRQLLTAHGLPASSSVVDSQRQTSRDICDIIERNLSALTVDATRWFYDPSAGRTHGLHTQATSARSPRSHYVEKLIQGTTGSARSFLTQEAERARASAKSWDDLSQLAATVGFTGTDDRGFTFPTVLAQLDVLLPESGHERGKQGS